MKPVSKTELERRWSPELSKLHDLWSHSKLHDFKSKQFRTLLTCPLPHYVLIGSHMYTLVCFTHVHIGLLHTCTHWSFSFLLVHHVVNPQTHKSDHNLLCQEMAWNLTAKNTYCATKCIENTFWGTIHPTLQ